jgi:hypothetical protein
MVALFHEWCGLNGYSTTKTDFISVGGYIVHFVVRLLGSSKSIDGITSAIKSYQLDHRRAFLDEADFRLLKVLKAELKKKDPYKIRRVRPLTKSLLRLISKQCDMNNIRQVMALTIMELGHDGVLRSGETTSGLKPSDVQWSNKRRTATIHLHRTKRCRQGDGEYVMLVDYGSSSGCRRLRQWFDRMELWDTPDAFIFPRFDERSHSFDFTKCTTTAKVRQYIKEAIASIGYDPAYYSGHSPRAGGATDLFLDGVSYPTIKEFGRWKSDAALLYYRSEYKVAYLVAAAFARMSKSSR